VYRRAAASEEQIRNGELEFEPSPQGIFTERLRAGTDGHLDVVILGGLQVSATADLANWWAPRVHVSADGAALVTRIVTSLQYHISYLNWQSNTRMRG
jgi:hypothetical protein